MSSLEAIVKETKAEFIIAVGDGVLDASEVIKIAVGVSQKVQAMALSGSEKKATLLLILKKGLDASAALESLPGLKGASTETKQAFEDQLINAASGAIDVLVQASQGKLNLRKPSTWLACLPMCVKAAQAVLPPKDAAILEEASKYATKVLNTDDPLTMVHTIAADAKDVVLEKAPEVVAKVTAAVTKK